MILFTTDFISYSILEYSRKALLGICQDGTRGMSKQKKTSNKPLVKLLL